MGRILTKIGIKNMKKLLIILVTYLLVTSSLPSSAAGAPILVSDIICGLYGGACPHKLFYNRSRTKVIADYRPTARKVCTAGSMSQWRLGHPNNAYGIGFTSQDWEDLEVVKVRTKGNYRWGDCCSSDAYNTICLW